MPHDYRLLTPELAYEIEHANRWDQGEYLFLEPSQEFRGCWQVDCLWPEYFVQFEPIIGPYRLVTPVGLENFLQAAKEFGYHVVFTESPSVIIEHYAQQNAVPEVTLESSLPHTVGGFLPWQIVGYNKLVKDDAINAGYVVWDTGAGKTAFIGSAVKYHLEIGHSFNLALVIAKSHNKLETQRKLQRLAGIESIILDGYKREKRFDVYEDLELRLVAGEPIVAITNYEKFREDRDFFKFLLRKRDCLFFWDEMPAKLSNPKTMLYSSIKKSLYDSFYSKPRPRWMRHWILSATPIENGPGDVWSAVNMVWPGLLGTQKEFEATYVPEGGYHFISGKPRRWHKLDRLNAKIGFMTHRVSKDDPEVAAMFPEVLTPPISIAWNPQHREIYDKLTGKAVDLLEELENVNILAMIQIMQMVCDAPSMVSTSALNREAFYAALEEFGDLEPGDIPFQGPRGSDIATALLSVIDPEPWLLNDLGHSKIEMWRKIICEMHPQDKIVTHSTWAEYIFPVWDMWLTTWGIPFVIYAGTEKQKQQALDRFRDDPEIRVFLSGDSGADSIDIAEARVGINYNIPWKWTTLNQREGRRDRVNSPFDTIYTYTLMMPDSVDERKLAVCERKRAYHEAIFDGRAIEESISASLTREELEYLITGSFNGNS